MTMPDLIHDPDTVAAVQEALLTTIGKQFGVMFSEEEADALLVALMRAGWTLEPLEGEQVTELPSTLPQESLQAAHGAVHVHVHVSPSDTASRVNQAVWVAQAALRDLPA
ncbi:hypothetical protein V5R04_15550 [Jonesiaceae bacterium BS-20]|uniref:Uncharacterized protein n=1 Tax=Jonesiaceae bacterium BS-20 TaxID=3120821 RepID=A0AAU7DWE3_9MICO